MEIEVSSVLATLKSDPGDARALEVLAKLHPGNGSGVDQETLAATLAGARRWHEERGDVELVLSLVDVELGWTPAGAARADLLVEKARLLHNEFLRWEAARSALTEAVEAVPGHEAARRLLEAIEAEEAGWEKAAAAHLASATPGRTSPERPAGPPRASCT
jgi:hypothetical protein